jgi:hypothetical protein
VCACEWVRNGYTWKAWRCCLVQIGGEREYFSKKDKINFLASITNLLLRVRERVGSSVLNSGNILADRRTFRVSFFSSICWLQIFTTCERENVSDSVINSWNILKNEKTFRKRRLTFVFFDNKFFTTCERAGEWLRYWLEGYIRWRDFLLTNHELIWFRVDGLCERECGVKWVMLKCYQRVNYLYESYRNQT